MKETKKDSETEIDASIYLMNFEKITITVRSYVQTEDLLEAIINTSLLYYCVCL